MPSTSVIATSDTVLYINSYIKKNFIYISEKYYCAAVDRHITPVSDCWSSSAQRSTCTSYARPKNCWRELVVNSTVMCTVVTATTVKNCYEQKLVCIQDCSAITSSCYEINLVIVTLTCTGLNAESTTTIERRQGVSHTST